MATVDEILARQAYADGDETWTKDNNYPSYTLYVEPEYVPVANKRIADFNDQISVRGEQNARFVGFQLPRYDDGLDLTDQHLYIHYQTVYGGSDSVPCNVSKSDSHVRMCWQVPAQATQEPGTIQMMIYATGTNSAGERVTWKTLPASYTIHDGLEIGGGIPEPDQSWYEQFVAQMEGKVSTAQGYANDAQASKTAAAGSATASAESAAASAKALADNKAYVESQKATFVGYNRRETDLKYANALIGSASGTTQVTVDDAWEAPIPGLEIAGKSEQGADPSPDNPQEIVSTDVTAVTVTGAQLMDIKLPSVTTKSGVTISLADDGGIRLNGTATASGNYRLIDPVQNLSINYDSATLSLQASGAYDGVVMVSDAVDVEWKKLLSVKNNATATGTVKTSKLGCYATYVAGTTYNVTLYPMLCASPTALPWEPYQSNAASITLTEPLRGIKDVRDRIMCKDGVWGVERAINQIDDTGTVPISEALEVLAVPTWEPLPADTQAALNALTAYTGRTTITVTAEGPEPDVAVEYIADTKTYIANEHAKMQASFDRQISAILALLPTETQAAMINNETSALLAESEV